MTSLLTPAEIALEVAQRARALRLGRGLTQAEVAARANISLSSLKRFEHRGRIAFDALVRLAAALGALDGLDGLFAAPELRSLDQLLEPTPTRQRGRRK